jgi:hypothetical protein
LAESPTSAFILSLLGGIFIAIGGFVVVGIGMLVESLGSLGGLGGLSSLTGGLGNLTSTSGNVSGAGVPIATIGGLGVLLGVATIALAVLVYKLPARHQLWGSLVVALSVLSWIVALGGLLVGFLLGLVGGVLAISWKPSVITVAPAVQITRICPNCGTVIQTDARFCPHCGKSLP